MDIATWDIIKDIVARGITVIMDIAKDIIEDTIVMGITAVGTITVGIVAEDRPIIEDRLIIVDKLIIDSLIIEGIAGYILTMGL